MTLEQVAHDQQRDPHREGDEHEAADRRRGDLVRDVLHLEPDQHEQGSVEQEDPERPGGIGLTTRRRGGHPRRHVGDDESGDDDRQHPGGVHDLGEEERRERDQQQCRR